MKPAKDSVRYWLYENDYKDILEVIDEIILEWKKQGINNEEIGGIFLPGIKKVIQE